MNPFEQGQVILINKPYDWTSFDVVRKIRSMIKIKKVGHAGTLDPLASGLLILCTGSFTKKISEFQDLEKEYEGAFYLGATRPSYDKETEKKFVGEIDQVPPVFSAIKVDGKRAYESARKGKELEMQPRKVTISE